jgi:hypothetical protein
MNVSPFALLVTAASDTGSNTERLVRAALLVSRASGDAAMAEWAARELAGYDSAEVPEYRQAPAMLMATDHYGRDMPVHLQDASARERASSCPLMTPLSEVIACAGAPEGNSFKILFLPEFETKLLKALPGAVTAFRTVQRGAFGAAVAAVRQKVFEWALEHTHENPAIPDGIDLAAVLGLPKDRGDAAPVPVEVRTGLDMSNAQLTGPVQIVMHSPGATAAQSNSSGADLAVLTQLVQTLETALRNANESSDATSNVVASVEELKALVAMPQPRTAWIKESVRSLRTVLEGAGGALVGELAKPHVQTALAHAFKMWG